jgi:hypothetical protein
MKKLIIAVSVVAVSVFGFISTSSAAQPKADILHCGCNLAGDDMEMTAISVSKNSKGHLSHSDIDSCFDGVETYTDVMRTHDDCSLGGQNLNPTGLALCSDDGTAEFDDCGAVPVI